MEAEVVEPIFANAAHAVHVSFLVMAQEAVQDAPLRAALIRAMESIKLDCPGQQRWLEQLRGSKGGAINFGGLSGVEVRAQCSMITAAVRTKLFPYECWVLQAKYGQTDSEEVDNDGQLPRPKTEKRRWAFPQERIEAIKGLADHFAPVFPKLPPFALDCLLARYFANHKKLEISSRDLAQSFGGNHMAYYRAGRKLAVRLRGIEQHALAKLEPLFIRNGVVSALQD